MHDKSASFVKGTVAMLLERGLDPSRRNNLGLAWNDVVRHVVRPEV